MSNQPKLSDFDLVVLAAAGADDDLRVLPLPASLKGDHETLKLPLQDLMRRGLIAEAPTTEVETIWCKTETGERLALMITDAGLAAIEGEAAHSIEKPQRKVIKESPPSQPAAKPKSSNGRTQTKVKPVAKPKQGAGKAHPSKATTQTTKLKTPNRSSSPDNDNVFDPETQKRFSDKTKCGIIIKLLKRKNGTTVSELMEIAGWQAHSIRGFMSGTVRRRYGLPLTSEKKPGKERRYRIKAEGEA